MHLEPLLAPCFLSAREGGGAIVAPQSKRVQVTPEILVPRLGERLVEKGLLTGEQLREALDYQKKVEERGQPTLLGLALIELGLIDRPTLDQAITEQIAQLQEALRQSNAMLEQRVKERTAELQKALNQLTELNRLKSDFISNISHELRTPLAHMVGYVDLLEEEALGPLTDEQRSATAVLRKSYHRLGNLIDNLLFLSFDTAEALQLLPAPTRLDELLPPVLEQHQASAATENVQMSLDIPSQLSPALIDPEKMEWALKQLVDNAIKFNRPNGKVHISARASGERIKILVTDTGIGIPADKLEEIFEPFTQIDGSSTRRYGGAGIGLTLAQRIVEAHGGKLKVESKEGTGTRISFSLPAAPD